MVKTTIPEEYIPDSSEAEYWLSEDVFVYRGQFYQLTEDCKVLKLDRNGKHLENKEQNN